MTVARTGSILLLVSSLALAACGSSAKKVDPAADLALAKRAVLLKADLPGYTSAPHSAGDDLPPSLKKSFDSCLKVTTSIFDDAPGMQQASSDDFTKRESQISGTTRLYPKKHDIDENFKHVADESTGACLQKLFEEAAKSGATSADKVAFANETVTRFDPGVGKHSVGYAVKLGLTINGQSAVLYADIVFLQRDRAGVDFEFIDVGQATDRALETAAVQKVYDRIGSDAK
jgi:hypothetical protein